MDRQPETREQSAIPGTRQNWTKRAVVTCLGLGLLCSIKLLAQNEPANERLSPTSPQSQVSFTQQPAPIANEEPMQDQHWRHTFPENECSADFWDPYAAEAAAMTESTDRVQQSYLDLIDPADTVEELPDEVVEAAEPVQPLDSEVVQPAERVQQLDDEVVQPEEPLGDMHPTRPWADDPGDYPD
jgi:hypothetical protein